MRLSISEGDCGVNAEIKLDGKVQSYVIEADEEQGYILKYVFDDDQMVIDPESTMPVIERLEGNVTIGLLD